MTFFINYIKFNLLEKFMKTIYNIIGFLSQPKNLYKYNDIFVVDNDEETSNVYAQNKFGFWEFIGVIRKKTVKL